MSDEAKLAEMDQEPETLADGLMTIPLNAFSYDVNLPSEGETVIVSWPGGLVRGTMIETHITLKPEIDSRAAVSQARPE